MHPLKVRDKRIKSEEKFQSDLRERMQELDFKIIANRIVYNIINEQKEVEKLKRNNEIKRNIITAASQNKALQYKQYILIYDILSCNFSQVQADLYNNRILKNDIMIALNFINSIDNNIVDEYHKIILINTEVII